MMCHYVTLPDPDFKQDSTQASPYPDKQKEWEDYVKSNPLGTSQDLDPKVICRRLNPITKENNEEYQY